MNEAAIQAAFIGVAGAILGALLTAFLQPLLTHRLSSRSELEVEITHAPFRIPQFLQDAMDSYRRNYKLNIRPTEQFKNQLLSLGYSHGVSLLKIKNKSKKLIEGVTVHFDGNSEFFCDLTMDGVTNETEYCKSFEIGNLRAGSECTLTFWTRVDNTSRWLSADKIVVSAREYDRISVRFPPPDYIQSKNFIVSQKLVWRSFWIFLALFNAWTFWAFWLA